MALVKIRLIGKFSQAFWEENIRIVVGAILTHIIN